MPMRRTGPLCALFIATALALASCASSKPLDNPASGAGAATSSAGTITIGSAAFAESEILAEVYAQALESHGITVNRKLNIGQRELYLKALQDGSIDLIPEYSGNLLQYYDKTASASSSADVYAQLKQKLPTGFRVLDQAQAQDKDSENVTREFSAKYKVTSLADLSRVPGTLKIAANPEFGVRPAGSAGLRRLYGVNVTLVPISDSGGPLTVSALTTGTVQLADIFTTSPAINANHLVTLKDPKNLILAQNVLPLIRSSKSSAAVEKTLNEVSKALTTADLTRFNAESVGNAKEPAAVIAKRWLKAKGI